MIEVYRFFYVYTLRKNQHKINKKVSYSIHCPLILDCYSKFYNGLKMSTPDKSHLDHLSGVSIQF